MMKNEILILTVMAALTGVCAEAPKAAVLEQANEAAKAAVAPATSVAVEPAKAAVAPAKAGESKAAVAAPVKVGEAKVAEVKAGVAPAGVRAMGGRRAGVQSRRGFSIEELKKDPERYAKMTNRWAQASVRQKEASAKALATLKAVDTKFLSEAEKASFMRLQELLVQRDADRAAFTPEMQGPEGNELRKKMMKTLSEIRELNRQLRPVLARALFQSAGADEPTAQKLADQLESVNAALR